MKTIEPFYDAFKIIQLRGPTGYYKMVVEPRIGGGHDIVFEWSSKIRRFAMRFRPEKSEGLTADRISDAFLQYLYAEAFGGRVGKDGR